VYPGTTLLSWQDAPIEHLLRNRKGRKVFAEMCHALQRYRSRIQDRAARDAFFACEPLPFWAVFHASANSRVEGRHRLACRLITVKIGSAAAAVSHGPVGFIVADIISFKHIALIRHGQPARESIPRRTGCATLVGVRIGPEMIAEIEAWGRINSVGRSEAIRRLIDLGLKAKRRET
jgi:hypothetical protein